MFKNRIPLTAAMNTGLLAFAVCASITSPALSDVAFRHTGNNDPALDDFPTWNLNTSGDPSGFAVGPASGENAWRVEGTGSQALYQSDVLTGADPKHGWKLTARLKVEGLNDNLGDDGIFLQFADGEHGFRMLFGSDGVGNAQVGIPVNIANGSIVIFPQTTFTTSGPGDQGYHLFEMVWTPNVIQHGQGTADLFINGQQVVNDFVGIDIPGVLNPPSVLQWGTTGGFGSGLFNFIQLETGTVFEELNLPEVIIPEPASLILLAAGGLLLLPRR